MYKRQPLTLAIRTSSTFLIAFSFHAGIYLLRVLNKHTITVRNLSGEIYEVCENRTHDSCFSCLYSTTRYSLQSCTVELCGLVGEVLLFLFFFTIPFAIFTLPCSLLVVTRIRDYSRLFPPLPSTVRLVPCTCRAFLSGELYY